MCDIKLLVVDAGIADNVEKAQTSARGKPGDRVPPYLVQASVWGADTIVENDYAKQQMNYPKTLTNMYWLMVEF